MKVIAIKAGYLGKLRQPGDEFEVPEGTEASWFATAEPVKSAKPLKSKPDEKAANGLV